MTEAEWNACTDPEAMLESLRGRKSARKQRLFACACCRLIWERFPLRFPSLWREAVAASERFADGLVGKDAVRAAFERAVTEQGEEMMFDGTQAACFACNVTYSAHQMTGGVAYRLAHLGREVAGQAATLLRDVFRPFRQVTKVAPSWLAWNNGAVAKLAEAIYNDHAFDRMPILADALEDAGCTDPDILAHCRGPNSHVRGCWVVDLLTGKE